MMPIEADCTGQVEQFIKCADPSWIYCVYLAESPVGFCCLEGWVCYQELPSYQNGGGVACGPPGYILQEGQEAISIYWGAYQGPAGTSTFGSPISSSTATTPSEELPSTTADSSGGLSKSDIIALATSIPATLGTLVLVLPRVRGHRRCNCRCSIVQMGDRYLG